MRLDKLYKTKESLYSVIKNIAEEREIKDEDIGKIFVSALSSMKESFYLSYYTNLRNEKTQRNIKRQFQEHVRAYFNTVRLKIIYDKKNIEEIIDRERINFSLLDWFREDTIEYEIGRILKEREDYENIGKAVLEGIKNYEKEKPKSILDGRHKIFLEYNRILKALKRI